MDYRKNVLVLCTRNSARSQMAEALLRKLAGDRFNVYSAGLDPSPIHPMVEPVMREIGLDVSAQRSKSVKEYLGKLTAHYLIVVCQNAERLCPRIYPGAGQRLFWPFPDPAAVEGTEEEQLAGFRRVRDEIAARLREWLSELDEEHENMG
ncbi:MAG: arsenate reductase ArsC [Thermoguttaceae bacterium]|jgi:arsenate reductase